MNPENLRVSPIENANLISKLFFCWLMKLFRLGAKRDLELEDLYQVSKSDKSESLGDQLSQAWEEELRKSAEFNSKLVGGDKMDERKSPSLLKAILKVFGPFYMFLGTFAFIEECFCKIAQPIFLGLLIRYFGGELQGWNGNLGYVFAAGLVAASMLYTVQHHPFFFATQHCGMRIRVACSSLIYRKALKLSQTALGQTTIGQLVNLLSNDVNRFDLCTGMLHYIWIGPVQLVIVIVILWSHFGWPCLVGVVLLVLFVPFQSQMGRLFGKLRGQVAVRTDRRVRIMNEIISAMRVVKMYTYEKPFASLVAECREDEVKYIKKTAVLRAINLSFFYISSKIIVFLTLLAYVLTGNYLTAEKVFVTLSLYNNVRLILTLFFPNGISQLAEVLVSITRLQNFLLMEDREIVPNTIQPQLTGYEEGDKGKGPDFSSEPVAIKVVDLSAKWNAKAEEMTLANVSLEVKKGKLLGVIGPVGCGKGSLLQAILRELPLCSGSITINGKVAYTSQEPWIFGGSVRDNILFGSEFDPEKYERTLESCALKRDLRLLPFGDNTLVGDRGTSLSGGQKARVNLARAVYAAADIYLLDDPLSAVDAEVGRHLFENCIMDTLKDTARILVTHQLQFLKNADEIILLNGGKVQAQGTYSQLLKTGINFAQLLKSEEANPEIESHKVMKRKGTGIEVLTGGVNKAQPEFRRSASMSMLEMGTIGGNFLIPEEFEWEEEPAIVQSYGNSYDLDKRRMSKPLVPTWPKNRPSSSVTKRKTPKSSSESASEDSPLLPQAHDESRTTGDMTLGIYVKYIRAGSSWPALIVLFLSNILVQVLFSGSDYWLQYWTTSEEARIPFDDEYAMENNTNVSSDKIAQLDDTRRNEVIIYSVIISALFIVSLYRTAAFLNMCLTSSVNLHKSLFYGVLRAPMRFFEINPLGRVLNRFAKDCGIIDETLPPTLFDTMEIFLQFLGVVVIVSTVNPYLLIPSMLLGILFYFIRGFYLKTARSVKRLEGIARSPVFSHLSTSLYGLTTIRAFRVEAEFEKQFDAHQDLHSATWYLFLATARWLGIFVDWCSVLYIGIVTVSFLVMAQGGAAAGLAISSAMTLTGMFQWGIRQSAETENNMVSVERVLEYTNLEPEASLQSGPGLKPVKSWPQKGQIIMKNVDLTYGDDAPVLKDITCTFKAKDKVGIVGRTGAGKSSLITALFRVSEPCSGSIEIDGINVLKIGLHDLRSKISIIPQDPVLFIGTLRRNLDPFNDYDDDLLWTVLEEVHLAIAIRDMPAGLDTEIAEGGSNFSVGQRQLICLGRAILRRNKILILDEATANVDPETDVLIQKTIREKFADCTVLTIAHRLHTVMDSDKILVLDAGRVQEYDYPYRLLLNTKSSLYQLVQQTGKTSAKNLIDIAKRANDKRQNLSMASVFELNEGDGSTTTSGSAEDLGEW